MSNLHVFHSPCSTWGRGSRCRRTRRSERSLPLTRHPPTRRASPGPRTTGTKNHRRRNVMPRRSRAKMIKSEIISLLKPDLFQLHMQEQTRAQVYFISFYLLICKLFTITSQVFGRCGSAWRSWEQEERVQVLLGWSLLDQNPRVGRRLPPQWSCRPSSCCSASGSLKSEGWTRTRTSFFFLSYLFSVCFSLCWMVFINIWYLLVFFSRGAAALKACSLIRSCRSAAAAAADGGRCLSHQQQQLNLSLRPDLSENNGGKNKIQKTGNDTINRREKTEVQQ